MAAAGAIAVDADVALAPVADAAAGRQSRLY
jgi:hypothetical protein